MTTCKSECWKPTIHLPFKKAFREKKPIEWKPQKCLEPPHHHLNEIQAVENVAARPSWIDLSGIKILWPHVFSSHSAPAYRDVQSVHNLLDTSNNNWGFHIYVHTWSPVFSALHSHQKINRYTTKCAFIIVQNYAICTETWKLRSTSLQWRDL